MFKGINPRKIHNNCKYICTQNRSSSYKAKINKHKRRNLQKHGNNVDFNRPFTSMDRLSNWACTQSTSSKSNRKHIFPSAHGTVSKTDYVLSHKASLRKCKESDIISNIFSDNNAMRSAIKYKKNAAKKHKHMETKQYATKQKMDHWRK